MRTGFHGFYEVNATGQFRLFQRYAMIGSRFIPPYLPPIGHDYSSPIDWTSVADL